MTFDHDAAVQPAIALPEREKSDRVFMLARSQRNPL
jgi:hypothetical protein